LGVLEELFKTVEPLLPAGLPGRQLVMTVGSWQSWQSWQRRLFPSVEKPHLSLDPSRKVKEFIERLLLVLLLLLLLLLLLRFFFFFFFLTEVAKSSVDHSLGAIFSTTASYLMVGGILFLMVGGILSFVLKSSFNLLV
jgi:hypothetical protein